MSYFGSNDFRLQSALGNVPGYSGDHKFGKAPDCDASVATDVWDGSDGVTSTDVWVPPTTARIHDITSTSAADDDGSTGMEEVEITGLTAWSSDPVTENVILNGTANVATVNSYVIIYRIKGVRFGAGGTNAGIITATAQTDATVTAAIQAGNGQTLMTIFGLPSTKKAAITRIRIGLLSPSTAEIEAFLLVDERADQADSGYLVKDDIPVTGGSDEFEYDAALSITGPALVKVQVVSDTNNTVCTATLCYFVEDQ